MRVSWCVISLLLLVSACGKNDGVHSVGYQPGPPIYQAPPPPGGGYMAPQGYQPAPFPQVPGAGYGGGGYPPAPYMTPTLPTGYPSRYTPFVPIDNFMRRRPETQNYWNQFWAGWQQYANRYRYDHYDFNRFWFEYCPDQWEGSDYANLYNGFDANVYFWVDMNRPIASEVQPDHFWQYYNGMPYAPYDGMCQDICY